MNIILFYINIISYCFVRKNIDIKKLVFSYLFSFVTCCCINLLKYEVFNISFLLKNILLSFHFIFIIYFILSLLEYGLKKFYSKKIIKIDDKKFFLISFIIILFGWVLVFLAYYPGIFGYDVVNQINQAQFHDYSTYQPLLHTLILNFFYNLNLENHTLGIAIYNVVQMIVFALKISFELLFVYRITKSKVNYLYLFWFSLLPIFSILSISVTKDIYFTSFFILFITLICYFIEDKKNLSNNYYNFLFVLSSVMVALFRNNGLYVVFIGHLFYMLLSKNKKIIFLCLISFLLICISNSLLIFFTSSKIGSKKEALSIPFQQIARVYNYEDISNKEKNTIEKVIPSVKRYRSEISDPVKSSVKKEFINNDFIKLYITLFIKYPNRYIEAFIHNNMGYLYVFDTTNSRIYGYGLDNRQGYLLTDIKEGYSVYHISYFKQLEKKYELLFSANKYQYNLITLLLCSFSLYLWLLFYYMSKLKLKDNVQNIYIILYILTMLLGPCALIRYSLPYISILPIIITLNYKKI